MRKTIVMLLLFSLISACQGFNPSQPTPEPLSMTFMAGYKPQANLPFVGVYVAQEKGYFNEEGLDVAIEHSAGGGEHLQLTASGKVHITTQDAAVLLKRRADPGLPLVSIALIGQRGQQAFAALASSGLKTPKDWEGRLVGFKGTPPPDLFALLGRADTDPEKIELVNVGFDPRLLVEGKIDVYPLYKSNEPYLLQSWGYDLVMWEAADFGVPTLGLTYVTSDDVLQDNPEMLTCFLDAALRGIDYAASNPDEAVEIVLKYTGPETNPDHMRFMLETELEDAFHENGVGWQSAEQWQALADMLVAYDAMPEVDIGGVFTTQIWDAVGNE